MISRYPNDLDDPTKFGVLFDRLLTMNSLNGSKSWNAKDLKMLAGENFINLFKKVEEVLLLLFFLNTKVGKFSYYFQVQVCPHERLGIW